MKWLKLTVVFLALAFIVLRGFYGLAVASSGQKAGDSNETHA